MYCDNCGYKNTNNTTYCKQCGRPLYNNIVSNVDPIERLKREKIKREKLNKQNRIIYSIVIGFILTSLLMGIIIKSSQNKIHLNSNETSTSITTISNTKKTVVETDNTYSNTDINTIEEAINLIKEDSNKQKDSCPNSIKEIENRIINEFNITSVNLCEMSNVLANELYKTLKVVFEMFPSIKGNITNITIGNLDSRKSGVIAFYQPLFPFAQSKNYNQVYKMRIVLNARYFLNDSLLQESVNQSSLAGYFPKNATISSPLAHELGHYISFYAMRKNNKVDQSLLYKKGDSNYYLLVDKYDSGEFSKQVLDEAYKLYLEENNKKIDFDEWRETISKYAVIKNEIGNYLYDETIAEAFHDIYLNKDNASLASKYIIKILRNYVEAL